MKTEAEIAVAPFTEAPVSAETVAAAHLLVRQQQVADGENDFRSGIESSQADLRNIAAVYIRPGGEFFVAFDTESKALAGFVGLRPTGDGEPGKLLLKRMAVAPSYRGRRLGWRLGSTAVNWAQERGFAAIQLTTGVNERARQLVYEPLGFAVVGYDPEHDDHIMELQLH